MNFSELIERSWEKNHLVSVLLELTYRCNLDCFFCYNDLGLKGRPLTLAQYESLLRDLAAMNVLNVSLSGGEPLAHRDFFAIGAFARELGFVVRVKSNGHALSGELARRLRDEVDPMVVELSLHGATAVSHDRQTRVEGSFSRLIENIGTMCELGLRVKVNSTLTLWNEGETGEMFSLCDRLGVPLRFDLQVSPKDDGDRSPLAIAPSPDGIRRLIRVEETRSGGGAPETCETGPTARTKYCGAGSGGIAVDPYGNVYPCVQWRRAVGSLHERPIHEIWRSSAALGDVRETAQAVPSVVAGHPLGKLLNFCPGLAEMMTGSATEIPAEMEAKARVIDGAMGGDPPVTS